jgi:hypothetical protein
MAWIAAAAALAAVASAVGTAASIDATGKTSRAGLASRRGAGSGSEFTPVAARFQQAPVGQAQGERPVEDMRLQQMLGAAGAGPPPDLGATSVPPQAARLQDALNTGGMDLPDTSSTSPPSASPQSGKDPSAASQTMRDAGLAVNIGASLANILQSSRGQAPPAPARLQGPMQGAYQPSAGNAMQQQLLQQQQQQQRQILQQQQQMRLRRALGGG